MMVRPPLRISPVHCLRVAILAIALSAISFGFDAPTASAQGIRSSHSGGGGDGGTIRSAPERRYDHRGNGPSRYSRSDRDDAYSSRYYRHRPSRHGYRRHSYRSYASYYPYRYRYGYGYGSRYYRAYPTPIYYYQPLYYGYDHPTSYQASLERRVARLKRELREERYGAFYWRSWPPYYRPQGPSAEGSCLYGADETLIYQPPGKSCLNSLAAR